MTETAYQNKTSLPYISPKLENVSFVKFLNDFGIRYLIWNLNTTFVKYLSKNRDMISTLSRTECVLYFVNGILARDLDDHLQCVIFLRCYQHIVDAVVVTIQNLHSSQRLFSFKLVQEFPECWVVRGNLRWKTSMPSFYAVISLGNSASVL